MEVTFQSHNWPHWGNDVVNDYMVNTAAVYKYINDQTLTYINQGYTSDEISNMIELPEALNKIWYTRPYYGTVAHNAKAVYQKFMGWYDSNPVNLNPLTPSDSAKKWVEYLGDVDRALQMAKADFDKGEYQWVAEITNAIVFADPTNIDAPAVRRRDGAAWVSGGIRPVAQRIPDRRAGAAPWQRESHGRREEHRRNGQSVVRADAV